MIKEYASIVHLIKFVNFIPSLIIISLLLVHTFYHRLVILFCSSLGHHKTCHALISDKPKSKSQHVKLCYIFCVSFPQQISQRMSNFNYLICSFSYFFNRFLFSFVIISILPYCAFFSISTLTSYSFIFRLTFKVIRSCYSSFLPSLFDEGCDTKRDQKS